MGTSHLHELLCAPTTRLSPRRCCGEHRSALLLFAHSECLTIKSRQYYAPSLGALTQNVHSEDALVFAVHAQSLHAPYFALCVLPRC